MRSLLLVASLLLFGLYLSVQFDKEKSKKTSHQALVLPPTLRIDSSKPRVELWKKLSLKQRQLAFHLHQAALHGRTIMFHDSHRHAIAMRDLFVDSVSKENIENTKKILGPAWNEYLVYVAKFLEHFGPYARGGVKYQVTQINRSHFEALFAQFGRMISQRDKEEIMELVLNPSFELLRIPLTDRDPLEACGGNQYEKGITREEVLAAKAQGLKIGLNCRIVRKSGQIECEKRTLKSPGIVGESLRKIAMHLLAALQYSETDKQKEHFKKFLAYLESGDEQDFRAASIAWVQDGTRSPVDFVIGWIETYEDWLSLIGFWESYLLIVDPEVTKTSKALAQYAQYFEDSMPYDYTVDGRPVTFRKAFPANYAPPAIMGYYFDEVSSTRTAGFNLPNYDDIRRDKGFKNVIKLPMPGSTDEKTVALRRSVLEAYAPSEKVEELLKHYELVERIHVLLHEVIGHGSGTFDTSKFGPGEEPTTVLGPYGAALEEERADLTGLVFGADRKLLSTGIVSDEATLKKVEELIWDAYIAVDFSASFAKNKTLMEAHLRGRLLLIQKLLEARAVAWTAPKLGEPPTLATQILRVVDYSRANQVGRELLKELQRIKAMRDERAAKEIFEKHAPVGTISEPWAQALLERGKSLPYFFGSVEQPWQIAQDFKNIELFGSDDSIEAIAPFWGPFFNR